MRWICDLDAARGWSAFGRRYPAMPHDHATSTTCSSDAEVDAVVIATPVFTHFDLASRACAPASTCSSRSRWRPPREAGQRAARSAREADGLRLMCGHTFLYSPPVRAVKELLDRGELGDIYFISSSRVNLGLHQRDVSVIWDLGPHDFSILLYWLERDADVGPRRRPRLDRARHPRRRLRRPQLPVGHRRERRAELARAEQAAPHGHRRQQEDGRLRRRQPPSRSGSSTTASSTRTRRPSASTTSPTAPATSSRRKLDDVEPLAVELDDFVRGDPRRARAGAAAELARDVVRMIEAAEESLRRGGARVDDRRAPRPGPATSLSSRRSPPPRRRATAPQRGLAGLGRSSARSPRQAPAAPRPRVRRRRAARLGRRATRGR